MKLSLLIISIFLSSSLFAQNLISFNTKDLPKAKGLDITVKHPSDWISEDSNRPNIVGKFVKRKPDEQNLMMLSVIEGSASDVREMKNGSIEYWRKANTFDNTKGIKTIKTKLENEDAFITDIYSLDERMNIKIQTRAQILQLVFKDRLVSMNCGLVTNGNFSESQLENRFKSIERDCFSFFNSLVLVQKYQK